MISIDMTPADAPADSVLSDAIRDALEPGHSENEFRYAFAAAMIVKIGCYSSPKWLCRAFFGQSRVLVQLAEADPALFQDILWHLEEALNRTSPAACAVTNARGI